VNRGLGRRLEGVQALGEEEGGGGRVCEVLLDEVAQQGELVGEGGRGRRCGRRRGGRRRTARCHGGREDRDGEGERAAGEPEVQPASGAVRGASAEVRASAVCWLTRRLRARRRAKLPRVEPPLKRKGLGLAPPPPPESICSSEPTLSPLALLTRTRLARTAHQSPLRPSTSLATAPESPHRPPPPHSKMYGAARLSTASLPLARSPAPWTAQRSTQSTR